jgi:Ni/Co efflux regulator RcnB
MAQVFEKVHAASAALFYQLESNMKSKTVVSVILAISLSSGGFSFAKGNEDRNDRGNEDRNDRGRNEQSHGQQDRGDNQGRQADRGERRAHNDERRDERGAGPNHEFRRGERLPDQYRHRQYVVDDWRGHQLSAPPRGYHWVQTGGDYVLVAIATGVILQLLLNN